MTTKIKIISKRSGLDVLKEANERNRTSESRTLLGMLRNRRIEREIRDGRQQLTRRVRKSGESHE
jgi:hypothetical protein